MASTASKTKRMVDEDLKGKAAASSKENEVSLSLEERIGLLAYSYWENRGCPIGSPDEDWFRAEREVIERQQAQSA